ncbi:MAG: hypothetical protein JWL61_1349 [Gemmatimonadetes bacterium]|jgi:hypothetical protein|nr:hypothetical protein [Gemmatimonadota bacterium]
MRNALRWSMTGLVTYSCLLACTASTAPSGPATLELLGPAGEHSVNVAVNTQILLIVKVKDGAGAILQSHSVVTFESRNPLRAEIDAEGRVSVRAVGSVYVVGSLASDRTVVRDSVLVSGFSF